MNVDVVQEGAFLCQGGPARASVAPSGRAGRALNLTLSDLNASAITAKTTTQKSSAVPGAQGSARTLGFAVSAAGASDGAALKLPARPSRRVRPTANSTRNFTL